MILKARGFIIKRALISSGTGERQSMQWSFRVGIWGVALATALWLHSGYADDRKYNPDTGDWETTAPDSTLQMNPMTGKREFAPPDSVPKYNPHTGGWVMAPQDAEPKYNSSTGQWEMVSPDATLRYDPYSGTYRYFAPEDPK